MHQRYGCGIGYYRLETDAVEMSNLRGVYGLMKWDGKSSENMCERCGQRLVLRVRCLKRQSVIH